MTEPLIDRLERYRQVATRTGNRTDNPMNVVRMIEEAQEMIAQLAECAEDLSQAVHDRDGLSNATEITLDLVQDIRQHPAYGFEKISKE